MRGSTGASMGGGEKSNARRKRDTRRRRSEEARWAAKSGPVTTRRLGEHLDCGCVHRRIRVLEVGACPGCGDAGDTSMIAAGAEMEWDTGTDVGERLEGAVSCERCPGERVWTAEVIA